MSRTHDTRRAAPPASDPVGVAVLADPAVAIVAIESGDLDEHAAARLLHWCEARLRLLDVGYAEVSHLVMDISHAHRATVSAVALLDHARSEAARRHVGIHLVGAGLGHGDVLARDALLPRRWSTFPTLDSAREELDPSAGREQAPARPVDPDAIPLASTAARDRLG